MSHSRIWAFLGITLAVLYVGPGTANGQGVPSYGNPNVGQYYQQHYQNQGYALQQAGKGILNGKPDSNVTPSTPGSGPGLNGAPPGSGKGCWQRNTPKGKGKTTGPTGKGAKPAPVTLPSPQGNGSSPQGNGSSPQGHKPSQPVILTYPQYPGYPGP